MIYSRERRLEVLDAAEAGVGTRQIALRFNCSESWVRRVKQEFRKSGKTGPATTRNRIPEWRAWEDQIRQATEENPDQTLQELKDRIGTQLSISTLCIALKTLKLTLKKTPEGQRTGPPRRGRAARLLAAAAGRPRSGPARLSR